VFQPEWGADGRLYFVWDETGWGQLYCWRNGRALRVHGRRHAELSRPQWVFGMRSYGLHPDDRIGAVSLTRGMPLFEVRDLQRSSVVAYSRLQAHTASIEGPVAFGRGFVALVSRPFALPAVVKLGRSKLEAVGTSSPIDVARGYLSEGVAREFQRDDGQPVYGFYYPPANALYRAPKGVAPPALIFVHGGPTSMADRGLKLRTQFFTSRGFAVFDINYSGSTGFGRAYRHRLDGQWGLADVADCAAAASHLARTGLADASRIAISGGSAGGYTTLMALATTNIFAAGSSHYGVSDLRLLLEHTHKFESGYLHRLVGTTRHNWRKAFAARSPLNLIDGIRAPVILFQGLDDKIVPPEQSRLIVENLQERGIEVAYHEFAGEGHGFRKAETIIAVLEAELAFLQRVLGLQ
jgi:dipeptidyl aminopeptidase/acylaminoacyl peptidase